MAAQGPKAAHTPRTPAQMESLRIDLEKLNTRWYSENLTGKEVQACLSQLQKVHGASGEEMKKVWGPITVKNKERAAASGVKLAEAKQEYEAQLAKEARAKAAAAESDAKLAAALKKVIVGEEKKVKEHDQAIADAKGQMANLRAQQGNVLWQGAGKIKLEAPAAGKPAAPAKPEKKEMKAGARH